MKEEINQLKSRIEQIEEKLGNPQTPQGDIRDLQNKKASLSHELKIAEREYFEKNNKCSVYGSDDYVGASAGDYSFYYGYEVTKCPIKSHKDDDDCYEKNCDKREWCFVASKGDKELVKWAESEFSYNQADDIERILIIGMAKFIKEYFAVAESEANEQAQPIH